MIWLRFKVCNIIIHFFLFYSYYLIKKYSFKIFETHCTYKKIGTLGVRYFNETQSGMFTLHENIYMIKQIKNNNKKKKNVRKTFQAIYWLKIAPSKRTQSRAHKIKHMPLILSKVISEW